jgi:hypothetical protein
MSKYTNMITYDGVRLEPSPESRFANLVRENKETYKMDYSYKPSITNTNPNLTYTTNTFTTTVGDPKSDLTGIYVNNIVNAHIDKQILKKVFEQEDQIKEELEAEKAAAELKKIQKRNKRLRGLIEKVTFSGPVTVVKWNDGSITRVRCAEGEIYDQEKGLLAAMAKKLYENTNIFVEELAYWCEQPEKDDDYEEYVRTIEDEDWEKLKDWFGYDD